MAARRLALNWHIRFQSISIALDNAGDIYFAELNGNRVRVLTPGTPPAVTPGGVVPVYSSAPAIQPGSWVSVYGSNLASGTFSWNGDFPTSLAGTSVMIDNKPAYLWFVSPTQINLQVPDNAAAGMVSVVVTTPSGVAASTRDALAVQPVFESSWRREARGRRDCDSQWQWSLRNVRSRWPLQHVLV